MDWFHHQRRVSSHSHDALMPFCKANSHILPMSCVCYYLLRQYRGVSAAERTVTPLRLCARHLHSTAWWHEGATEAERTGCVHQNSTKTAAFAMWHWLCISIDFSHLIVLSKHEQQVKPNHKITLPRCSPSKSYIFSRSLICMRMMMFLLILIIFVETFVELLSKIITFSMAITFLWTS